MIFLNWKIFGYKITKLFKIYLDINSVRIKFFGLASLVFEQVDILIVAKTQLKTSFPTS